MRLPVMPKLVDCVNVRLPRIARYTATETPLRPRASFCNSRSVTLPRTEASSAPAQRSQNCRASSSVNRSSRTCRFRKTRRAFELYPILQAVRHDAAYLRTARAISVCRSTFRGHDFDCVSVRTASVEKSQGCRTSTVFSEKSHDGRVLFLIS